MELGSSLWCSSIGHDFHHRTLQRGVMHYGRSRVSVRVGGPVVGLTDPLVGPTGGQCVRHVGGRVVECCL